MPILLNASVSLALNRSKVVEVTIWPLIAFAAIAVVVVAWASWSTEQEKKANASDKQDKSGV